MAALHLTSIQSAISMVRDGINEDTFFDVIMNNDDIIPPSPIQGAGSSNKDLRCCLCYDIDEFSQYKMAKYDSYDIYDRELSAVEKDDNGINILYAGEYVLTEFANINPALVIIVSKKKTQHFNDLISLCRQHNIKYLVISDINAVIACIVYTWDSILTEEYEAQYPPDIYGLRANNTKQDDIHIAYSRYLYSFMEDILDNIASINKCFNSYFDRFMYKCIFTFILSWLDNQPRNTYTQFQSQQVGDDTVTGSDVDNDAEMRN